jgi:hypothetical protein
MKSKFLIAGVGAAAGASAHTQTAPAALADPPSGTFRTYVAVGSDTIQDVWNGLSNSGGALAADSIASYDAFPQGSYIQTQSGGNSWLRPSGSTAGVKFLSAAVNGGTWPTPTGSAVVPASAASFARSSSGPVSGSGLTYIPFARDAVSVAFHTTTGLTSLNITTSQLTELYSGVNNPSNDTSTPGSGASVDVAVSGTGATATATIAGVAVQPKIPQPDSGTRKFFLGAIGVATPAVYIEPTASTLAENTGASIPNAGDLIPFSVAQWIAQVKGTQSSTIGTPAPTGYAIASVNGLAPTTGSGASTAPGALFGHATGGLFDVVPGTGVDASNKFERDTYNVIPTSFKTGTVAQQNLYTILGDQFGDLVQNGQSTLGTYGFGALAYAGDNTKELSGAFQ